MLEVAAPLPSLRYRLESRVDALPGLPTVVARLMSLDPRAPGYVDQLCRLVEEDADLTSRILDQARSVTRLSSSLGGRVSAVIKAIGADRATNIVIALAIARTFVPKNSWEKSLWRHAVQVALCARALVTRCRTRGVDPEQIFLCGLLHDVGRFMMFEEAPDQLRVIDEGQWHTPEALGAVERAVCGMTHSELGAMVCTKWRLPVMVIEAVREHHTAAPGLPEPLASVAAVVRFADAAMTPSSSYGVPTPVDTKLGRLIERKPAACADLTAGAMRELMASVEEETRNITDALGLWAIAG